MTINKTLENRVCTLFIEGRIDTLTAPQLKQAFADNADRVQTPFSSVLLIVIINAPLFAYLYRYYSTISLRI